MDEEFNGLNNEGEEKEENLISEEKDLEEEKHSEYKKGIIHGIIGAVLVLVLAGLVFMGVSYLRYMQAKKSAEQTQTTEESGDASGDNVVSELTLTNTLTSETLEKLGYIYAIINRYYCEDVDVDDMLDGMYAGLLEGIGDAYSSYYTVDEYKRLSEKNSGSYAGIGATFSTDPDTGYPIVMFVYPDTPAEDVGLEAGDIVIAVDDEDVSEMELEEVVALIRGEEGVDVTLTYIRGEQVNTVVATREEVELASVAGTMLDDGVGYLRITSFTKSTGEQFEEYTELFLDEGMTSMIIDLRNNGGGLIDGAADVLDYLLPEGTIVYTVEEKDEVRKDYTSDEETKLEIPIVVLINGNTASASEIFAEAIREFEWGTLVGTTTYGKGVYQVTLALPDGSAVKVTNGKFYSSSGKNFDGVGIDPDVELEYENLGGEDADYSVDNDNQIQKAVELLIEE
ncbi:MAG: S41 family peptidase [Eubacterium sp.]|nr:S41 family peptidase [Eubacterium sp.]